MIMKTVLKVGLCACAFVLMVLTAGAQTSNKELKKELKAKVEKDCRKEAKRLAKEGWRVMPGKLSLEKQIQEGRFAELSEDDKGAPLYLTATHSAQGGNYSAAQKIAYDRARQQLAGNISTSITELLKNNVANTNYGEEDLELIDEFVSTSQNLVSLSLQGVSTVLEIYRENGNVTEVQVMLKVNMADAMKAAKESLKTKLQEQSEDLARKLDQLLKSGK